MGLFVEEPLQEAAVGYVLQWTHSYAVLFVIASGAYLLALLLIHLLVPRLEPVTVEAYPDARP